MQVAIIGAGLMGRILGWRLNELGANITLIDAKPRKHKGTALVAAAMIAPGTEAVTTEPLVEALGRRSMQLWQPWLDQLNKGSPQSVYYKKTGTLLVAHSQDKADWQRFMQHAETRLQGDAFQYLNASELEATAPDLAQNFDHASFFPEEAVLDNQQLFSSLETYFDQHQVPWHENAEINALSANGTLKGYDTGNGTGFDWVFDCRGNGAQNTQHSLRAVRGEIIRVRAPEVNIKQAVRLMHPRYPLYIAPKQDHHYVIGATQIESDDDAPVTVRSGLELLSALYSLHKGFAEANIISMDVGLRPAFPDNLPRIRQENKLIHINGLFRHGYLFAPAIAEDICALLEGRALRFPQLVH